MSRFGRFEPAGSADAPTVTFFEARESILGGWRDEVVPAGAAEVQEILRYTTAYRVDTKITRSRVTIPVPVVTGPWRVATQLERSTQNIAHRRIRPRRRCRPLLLRRPAVRIPIRCAGRRHAHRSPRLQGTLGGHGRKW